MSQSIINRFKQLAKRCRQQAAASDTEGKRAVLTTMADDYEADALREAGKQGKLLAGTAGKPPLF